MLRKMDAEGIIKAVQKFDYDAGIKDLPVLDLKSTYITRAESDIPKCGDRGNWLPRKSYLWDFWEAKYGDVSQGILYSKEHHD
ncbi:FAD-containing monooxygenase [Acrasis kona]|uniref:FAD-containing monooxygenase n=1 Tax=Acrasis kona TaxID=1008807 RepID=A0AAW2ZI33_9EUKA